MIKCPKCNNPVFNFEGVYSNGTMLNTYGFCPFCSQKYPIEKLIFSLDSASTTCADYNLWAVGECAHRNPLPSRELTIQHLELLIGKGVLSDKAAGAIRDAITLLNADAG